MFNNAQSRSLYGLDIRIKSFDVNVAQPNSYGLLHLILEGFETCMYRFDTLPLSEDSGILSIFSSEDIKDKFCDNNEETLSEVIRSIIHKSFHVRVYFADNSGNLKIYATGQSRLDPKSTMESPKPTAMSSALKLVHCVRTDIKLNHHMGAGTVAGAMVVDLSVYRLCPMHSNSHHHTAAFCSKKQSFIPISCNQLPDFEYIPPSCEETHETQGSSPTSPTYSEEPSSEPFSDCFEAEGEGEGGSLPRYLLGVKDNRTVYRHLESVVEVDIESGTQKGRQLSARKAVSPHRSSVQEVVRTKDRMDFSLTSLRSDESMGISLSRSRSRSPSHRRSSSGSRPEAYAQQEPLHDPIVVTRPGLNDWTGGGVYVNSATTPVSRSRSLYAKLKNAEHLGSRASDASHSREFGQEEGGSFSTLVPDETWPGASSAMIPQLGGSKGHGGKRLYNTAIVNRKMKGQRSDTVDRADYSSIGGRQSGGVTKDAGDGGGGRRYKTAVKPPVPKNEPAHKTAKKTTKTTTSQVRLPPAPPVAVLPIPGLGTVVGFGVGGDFDPPSPPKLSFVKLTREMNLR